MATKQFWLLATTATTPDWFGVLQDGGSAPTAANSAYGWTVGTAANQFWRARLGATGRATVGAATSRIDSQTAPVAGTGAGVAASGDSLRTPTAYTGTFAAGNWTLAFTLRPVTITAVGRIRCRVWAGTSIDGVGARELTSGAQVGSTVTLNSTTTSVTSSATWAAPAVTLTNEYLFFQLEWNETTVGTAAGTALVFRLGEASITTTNYLDVVTGTLAVTGGADTSAFSGTVAWNAVLAGVESSAIAPTADSTQFTADDDTGPPTADAESSGNTAYFTGIVGATSVTGTMAATETVADSVAFTGTVGWTAILAATDGASTASFTGAVAWPVRTGTLAVTEGIADAASFTGTVGWAAILAATEGAGTASFGGSVAWPVLSGTLAATEASQGTAAFAGSAVWFGTLAVTEGADVFDATGTDRRSSPWHSGCVRRQ